MDNLDDFFSYKINKTSYFFNEGLKEVYNKPYNSIPDFSDKGSNLCISILNYNRVGLTIKLLESIVNKIPNFKGEILIIDNKSSDSQIDILEKHINTLSLDIEVKKLDENNGVGRARNIAAKHSSKEWIMFLDSDMFFIENPLKKIRQTITTLGVHYLNIPIIDYDRSSVFALGGALFMSNSKTGLIAGGGSVFSIDKTINYKEVKLDKPFLSDFLFGGSSVIHRKSFLSEGGFDYDMFVGFEDVDFSFRLYKKSIKIGNIPMFPIVHDHKPSDNIDDVEAEKIRYSNSLIEKSGNAFFNKHKIEIYDQNTKDWLKTKQLDILKNKKRTHYFNSKPYILLVIDKRNWAFHNIAKNIKKHLHSQFTIDFLFSEDYQGDNWINLYYDIFQKKSDIVYFFWRPQLFFFNKNEVINGLCYRYNIIKEDLYEYFNNTIFLTSIYDHLYTDKETMLINKFEFENFIDGYTVSSEILNNIYQKEYPSPFMVIQDGVDLEKFKPQSNIPLPIVKNQLILGWVGNSKWGINEDNIDHKGFISIIKPSVEQLQSEGYNIVLKYADSAEPKTKITHDDMVNFYNSIDVYICMSDIEGTPNTVLEAMACGKAIISTNVGIVPEVFGKKQKKYLLNRDIKSLKKTIISLIDNNKELQELSKENLIRIKNWSWKKKCELFELFFLNSLNKTPKIKFNKEITLSKNEEKNAINLELVNRTNYTINHLTKQNKDLEKKLLEEKEWYLKEYEILPLWYKRFGHIIKIILGKKNIQSKNK